MKSIFSAPYFGNDHYMDMRTFLPKFIRRGYFMDMIFDDYYEHATVQFWDTYFICLEIDDSDYWEKL